jgi:hypothetical protein
MACEPLMTVVGTDCGEEAVPLSIVRPGQSDLSSHRKSLVGVTHLWHLAGGEQPRPYLAVSDGQGFSGVGPLEGLGEYGVEVLDDVNQ